MLFKLKAKVGTHVERDKKGKPVTYKSGDDVESEHDLVEMFSGKFERVLEDSPETSPKIPMSNEKVKTAS